METNNNQSQLNLANENLINIRITEDPLTAQNFALVISALTEMHVKFWLVQQGRFGELLEYYENPDISPMPEASLVISKMSYHSPLEVQFISIVTNPLLVGQALRVLVRVFKIALEAVTQAPYKKKEAELKAQALEQDIKLKEQQLQLNEATVNQQLQQNAQRAELENEKGRLELEQKRLLLQIEAQRARLAADKERVDFALDLADKVVQRLYPDSDAATRGMISRTLLPELLQLGKANGLELALPAPYQNEHKVITGQEI